MGQDNNKPKPKEEKLDTQPQFFQDIIRLHGKPCYLLLELSEDSKIKILAVASSPEYIPLVTNEKVDYMG